MSDLRRIVDGMNTPEDLTLIGFEKAWGNRPGKLTAALGSFGLGETAYYARLARAIENPACEAAEPVLVHRLRARVDAKARLRSAVRRGTA